MSIHKLDNIFKPERIALIGVSANPNSVSGVVLRNIISGGFQGVVYPVNPDREAVLGIQCYKDLAGLPKKPDLAVIVSAAEEVPGFVSQCGKLGINGIIIMSAGFSEAGEKGAKLEMDLKKQFDRFSDMRIIGPNCLGIIVPGRRLNISFAAGMPGSGNLAFISQSGALCTSILDWAMDGKIGFSNFVSIGNSLDVEFGDLIDYFGEDEETKSILLYIESVKRARRFMSAARSFARSKPIIAYKAGRFAESARAAASHTGALATEDAVYDAAFKRAGIVRVFDIGDIFDCAGLIGKNRVPKGPNLGIVTNAGGPGVMATDALIASGGRLAVLEPETISALNEKLPHFWSGGNPVDVLGDARSKRITKAAEITLADKNVDALLVILTPQAMTNVTTTAKAIGELAEGTKKPILAAWVGSATMREGIDILNEKGAAAYQTPEQAIRAFMTLVSYSRNLQTLYETPRDMTVRFDLDRDRLRNEFREVFRNGGPVLSEEASKHIIRAYGIPVTTPLKASTAEKAVLVSEKTGYPVVMKIDSANITHKTEAGGVELDLKNGEEVRAAYDRMMGRVNEKTPGSEITGVTVQPMAVFENGLELILGIKKDPLFGPVIMTGMGGMAAELYRDRALGFPPLNERLGRQMLESLKMWPLLKGYRGKPGADIDRLLEILVRLSYLAADYPEILELDINPLLISDKKAVALDARIIIDPSETLPGEHSSHMVLRPYPDQYVVKKTLKDGTEVTLRPIKPEDEQRWMDMLASCSRETIYSRFRYFFQWVSHEVASRYCYIDYDREMAIVAELEKDGVRELIGVGRMIADPGLESAEYAVLIVDDWQEKELGTALTNYCLEIASEWNLKTVTAQTSTENRRMVSVFKKLGFEISIDPRTSDVTVIRNMAKNAGKSQP